MTTITKRYTFEAGHFLPKVPEGHKCARQHGHNYEVEVSVTGSVRDDGMVMDFFELDRVVNPLVAQVDHRNLNDIPSLENPTAELIAAWFFERIVGKGGEGLPGGVILKVTVFETKDCWASYPA